MLARRSSITHPVVGEIELPLLVPAFSSKGFKLLNTEQGTAQRQFSSIAYELADFGRIPARSMLVSAYDLHHRYFDPPEAEEGEALNYLQKTAVVFLDSGGYELQGDFDLTEPKHYKYDPGTDYSATDYDVILENFRLNGKGLSLVIANFDHGTKKKSIDQQISEARKVFRDNPDCATDFILKPWTPTRNTVDPHDLSDNDIGKLSGFDIIGVTEKELGNDLLTRLKGIALLRKKLTDNSINSPIHIWGGLDPVMTPLYFFAGAEIFDGISWLRYAYHNGMSVYRECFGVLCPDLGISAPRQANHAVTSVKNRLFINGLEDALQQWVDSGGSRFDKFHKNVQSVLEDAYGVMISKIPELNGGA